MAYFVLWGAGAINNSANNQTVTVQTDFSYATTLQFRNSATAGERMTYLAPAGDIIFFESANGGSATFAMGAGSVAFVGPNVSAANASYFSDDATAGNAFITNQPGGDTNFCASAGNATIINEGATTRDESAGWTTFCTTGSGESATIINNAASVNGGEGGYTNYNTVVDEPGSPTIINNGSAFGGASGRQNLYLRWQRR